MDVVNFSVTVGLCVCDTIKCVMDTNVVLMDLMKQIVVSKFKYVCKRKAADLTI